MKPKTLFTAALLCGGSAVLASATAVMPHPWATTPATASVAYADDFEALAAEYEAAKKEFSAKLKEADKTARREMRANPPAKTYWPKFVAMSEAGNGQATLWLASNIRDNKDIKSKMRGETLTPLYQTLVTKHAGAEWFEDAIKSIGANQKYIGNDVAARLLVSAVDGAKSDNVKAAALFYAAGALEKSDPEKAAEYMARIGKEFSNTMYGTAVAAKSSKASDSEVGKVAPNFAAQTIDGFNFDLESYRGKVVALDFYGFW